MEDKPINSAESIALIQRMITTTRKKYESMGGSLFLIWGYISFLVSALILCLIRFCENLSVLWLWFLIPLIGYPAMMFFLRKKEKPVKTHIDQFINYIWLCIGSLAVILPIIGMFSAVHAIIIPLEACILSLGVILTALAIDFKPLLIGGIIAVLLSFLLFFVSVENYQAIIGIFMLCFVSAMIIPGHILNCRKKCSKN